MRFQPVLPHPLLREWVQGYWLHQEWPVGGLVEHSMLPEKAVRITFLSGQSWHGRMDGGSLVQLPAASLTGLMLQPQRMLSKGKQSALVVELYPWGAKQLFGWNATDPSIDLQVKHRKVSHEVGGLLDLGDWDGALQQVEAWLLDLLFRTSPEIGKGVQAALQVYETLGSARISTLAEEMNLSPRQLERHFTQQVGVTPKVLARLVRFQEAYQRIRTDPAMNVAALAVDLGFFDQAHLIREFRTLASITPGAYAQIALQRMSWPEKMEDAPVPT